MFHSHVPRCIATAVAAVALSIGGFAVLAGSPAGAIGGPNPTGGPPPATPGAPGILSEVDCFAGAPANQALPVILGLQSLQINTGSPVVHPTSLTPTGVQFGVSGDYTTTFVGAFVEGDRRADAGPRRSRLRDR